MFVAGYGGEASRPLLEAAKAWSMGGGGGTHAFDGLIQDLWAWTAEISWTDAVFRTNQPLPAGSITKAFCLTSAASGSSTTTARVPLTRATERCKDVGRVVFCPQGGRPIGWRKRRKRKQKMKIVVSAALSDSLLGATVAGERVLGARAEMMGPVSIQSFDDTGTRTLTLAMPHLGRSAHWQISERDLRQCGVGGVLWPMGIVLADYVSRAPEYPRLRVLELGAGSGLSALALSRRGHHVVATDGDICVLHNLQRNVEHDAPSGSSASRIRVERLRWGVPEDYAAIQLLGPFDLITGADVCMKKDSAI